MFVNETILTGVFVMVILMVKGTRTTPSKDGIAGILSISLTLLACIRTGGRLGGCFNPAVGLSVGTYSLRHLEDTNGALSRYLYTYIVGPLCGGILAGAFHLLHKENYEHDFDRKKREFDQI